MVLKTLWEVKTSAKVGRVVGSVSHAYCLLLGSDDGYGFANYDLDDEMQGDTPSAQVDIDPYAGVPTQRYRTGAC